MLTRPLRFAMVTTFYPPYCTDDDGYDVQRWARALTARGHSVDVIHDTDAYRLLTGSAPVVPFEEDHIRIHRLRSQTKFLSTLGVQQMGRPTTHRERLEELLVGRYDVIHYHNISLIGGPGLWKIGTGIKLHTAHDFWLVCAGHTLWRDNEELCDQKRCIRCVYRQGRPPQLWRLTSKMKQMASHIDAFLMPSEAAVDVHKEFGFEHPMTISPPISAVSTPKLKAASVQSAPMRPYVFFSGKLDNIHGLDDVIPQFADELNLEFLIAGIGVDESPLRRLAEKYKNVKFLGPKSATDTRALCRDALAVVAPLKGYEVFPNSILEAFRLGKPVLARDIGPNRKILKESGGGLSFSTGDDLRVHLGTLSKDPSLVAELGRKAFAYFAEEWREDVAVDAYLEIVRDIARAKGLSDLITKIDEAPSRFLAQRPS